MSRTVDLDGCAHVEPHFASRSQRADCSQRAGERRSGVQGAHQQQRGSESHCSDCKSPLRKSDVWRSRGKRAGRRSGPDCLGRCLGASRKHRPRRRRRTSGANPDSPFARRRAKMEFFWYESNRVKEPLTSLTAKPSPDRDQRPDR